MLYGGEPLVIKSTKRFLDHCAEHAVKVTFITNGTAVSEEMANKIALDCHAVTFSLNAATKETHEIGNVGSKFDKVIRNIDRVIDAKKRLNGKVAICGHMTIVPENLDELPLFIEKREEFGVEAINFSYDVSVPPLLASRPDLKERLAAEVVKTIGRCGRARIEPSSLRRLFGSALERI
jgi:MoaA/NifB/PqqE/SkfB family radical SAM enzyme